MITFILILLIIVFGVLSFNLSRNKTCDSFDKWWNTLTIGLIIGMMISIIIYVNTDDSKLDVYRGKTELKINGYYKNGTFIVTDSVVVYKRK